MKRKFTWLLILSILCTCLALPAAQAADYATATVKGGWLRLREAADADSKTISAYFTGTTVTILGGSGSWYYVQTPDGKTGYMHSGYLTITGSITGGQLAENTAATVVSDNGKSVRLRSGPSTQYSTLGSYAVGTPLTVLTTGDTWCKIRINGRTGYMMTEYISAGGTLPRNYTAYVVADNGKNCVVRGGASKQDAILASWEVGKQVTVVEYGSTWSRVKADGITGYMMSQYLSTTRPEGSAVSGGYTAYVTSGNGLSVRMRSGAGKLFPTIATYSVGTQVTVLEKGSTWSKIRVGSNTGYMMTEFLTTKAPSVGVTVKISMANAEPGDILVAQVTPATANVSVAWVNDKGSTLAYGSTYTVRSSDVGRKIRASATGIGGTSGSDVSGWCYIQSASASTELTNLHISDTTPTVGQTLTVTAQPASATVTFNWIRDDGVQVATGATYTVRASDVGYKLYVYAIGTGNTTGQAMTNYTSPVAAQAAQTIALQSVAIEDTTPNVGQTLSVTLKPANATATYIWRCSDGRILGYDETYKVTEEENGKQIYVYANGTGNTTGSVVSSLTSKVTSAETARVRIDGVALSDLTPVVGQTLVATVSPGNANALLTWYRDDDVLLTYGSTYTVRAADEGHSIYVWAEGMNGTFGSATSKMTGLVTK